MDDQRMDDELAGLRNGYNSPPDTPREEMWSAIQARLEPRAGQVLSMEEALHVRSRRRIRALRWATAAAAVLVVGVGIGRMTAPGSAPETAMNAGSTVAVDPDVFRAAAVDHLVRTESLLTLVRADARSGRVPASLDGWSRNLLSQTRLLMDAEGGVDPVISELLEDLELVLVQIVGVAGGASGDQERVRSEMNLALQGLEESDVLPRIQAVVPAGPGRFGT